ncbi:MAG: SDR family NAD(P)-dependent oxidoreductase [Acidimicrobiales bacterium]
MGLISGKACIVTGGASGIGRAVTERFVAEGAVVGVLDVSLWEDGAAGPTHAAPAAVIRGDVRRPAPHEQVVAEVVGLAGKLDVLVCCAGRFDFQRPVATMAPDHLVDAFDEIFSINVLGSLLAVRAAAAELRRARGAVVLTSSSSAYYAEGAGALYGASKWAVRGLVAHLARELAPEVRVNGVAPGGTARTRLQGVSSLGQHLTVEDIPGRDAQLARGNLLARPLVPEDHSGAYLYLACDALAAGVTGTTLRSDGGRGAPVEPGCIPPAGANDRSEPTDNRSREDVT